MGRKKTSDMPAAPAPLLPAAVALSGDIVPDGDFAGMRADEVLRLVSEDIHEALGECSLDHAGAALDMVLGDYLAVLRNAEGDLSVKKAALNFCETALPYATLPTERVSYAAMRKIKGGRAP